MNRPTTNFDTRSDNRFIVRLHRIKWEAIPSIKKESTYKEVGENFCKGEKY